MLGQPVPQILRPFQLVWAEGGGVPLRRFHVVDGHKSRLAAHGQTHIIFIQLLVHRAAERIDGRPLVVAIRLGDARVFVNAHHAVVEAETDFALVHRAGDRRGADRVWRAGERNVVFASKQAGGRVKADPASTRHIDLGPGMQVGKVGFRAGWAIKRFHISGELHQITRYEARGKAQMSQNLNQQPGAVAARAAGQLQGFLTRLDTGLHADVVFERLPDLLIEVDQKVLGRAGLAIHFLQQGHQQRAGFRQFAIRHQFLGELFVVFERVFGGVFLQKEIKRVDHGHVRDHLHFNVEVCGLLRKHQPGQIVAERVLLPVDEMLLRQDAQRITQNRRAAVRGGAQAQDMRRHVDGPVVLIVGLVANGDADSHGLRQ